MAVGDITDTAQIIGTDGKPVGTGPYFGVGFDASIAGAEALTPFKLHEGEVGDRARPGRDRPGDREVPGVRGR